MISGAIAVLVTLVAEEVVPALITPVMVVQQLEGDVLHPWMHR
ncbi:hypothetical protein [Actinopolyspora saharensis]|nr:hypothetical protein [Actinopolyspora saharensis]